jgi:hypothetical protein
MTIYFDKNKNAYAFEIPNPLATVDDETWHEYWHRTRGVDWDIVDGKFVVITSDEEIAEREKAKELKRIRAELLSEADWRIQRCNDEIKLALIPTKDDLDMLIQYRQYLRELTEMEGWPDMGILDWDTFVEIGS